MQSSYETHLHMDKQWTGYQNLNIIHRRHWKWPQPTTGSGVACSSCLPGWLPGKTSIKPVRCCLLPVKLITAFSPEISITNLDSVCALCFHQREIKLGIRHSAQNLLQPTGLIWLHVSKNFWSGLCRLPSHTTAAVWKTLQAKYTASP